MGESKVVSFEGTYLRTSGIMGQVTADDVPQEGITVSLQGRGENKTVTTNGAGQFAFEQLRRGDYSVGISGYDTDEMTFDVTSQSVTVAYGETASVPFEGILLRTAGVMGTVSVEGVGPIEDVTVTIQGEGETLEDMTDHMGAYSFENLRAGDYSVVISGFNNDQYGFPDGTSATVTVELQETGTVPFDGIMLRTAAIEGTVTVGDDDAPLPGVMVTVNGGPKDEEHSTTTNDDGMYMVENLHAGVYSVSISGYDTNEYGFNPTTESVDVGLRETAEVAFQGDLLRTAGVSGRVHVNGMGIEGVTVTMTGEEDRMGMTDADGQYGFSGLAAGDYTLTISGWDEVEYHFEPMMEIALELDESMTGVNFAGKALRTATVMGSVMVEGAPLPGIAVTLIKVISANSGEILGAMPTGADGGYSFGPLLAGAYQVMIAGYADEHDFAAGTTQTTVVMTDGTAEVNFMATIIRTASVSGMVTVDGEAMEDVEVTLTGDHAGDDNSMMTDEDGMYTFGGLRKGDYTVTVTNPDEETYSFPATSQSVNLSVGQEQGGISFAGARLKQASISGQVHAEGMPVEGVMVTLSGDADGEDMTDANGEYNFPGLAGGDYMVAIAGWDEDAYEFATAEAAVEGLGTDEFRIQDFAGMHTRTASIGGMLFIDAGDEPVLDLDDALPMGAPGLPITLLGPELGDETLGFASREGMYMFDGLRAGAYVLSIDVETEIPLPSGDTTTVEAVLAMLGYKYTGKALYNVTVAAAEEGMQNLPFEITMQTIAVGAVMGTEKVTGYPVAGVKLALYATTEDNSPMLGTGTTDSTGVALFHFPRAMDLGPGGTGNDHLVFAKVTSTGHDDLVVSDNAAIEIEYEATDRVSHALTAVRLLNNRANFQWWIKSDEEAKDGNEFLGGWKVVLGTDTIATGADGKGSYSGTVVLGDKPATMMVMADTTQADSLTMGEKWMQSKALTYTHNPLALPAMNMAEMNDLGPVYVTFTTQALVLGVYRETDDEDGFTNYVSPVVGGDHRPAASTGAEMTIELMVRDDRNRLQTLEYDHDFNAKTDPIEARGNFGKGGMLRFEHLPADAEITARFRMGSSDRVLVSTHSDIETFGDDLDLGSSVGAFGMMSGAGPEVRVCSASEGTTDDECATYGYQWKTGSLSGMVGLHTGNDIAVMPTTGQGAAGKSDTTRADGNYALTGLQDGTYNATAANNNSSYSLNGAPTRKEIEVYHDEFADDEGEDKADSAWAGNRDQHTETWNVTRVGLKIMGYVGNDNGDRLMRGDESIAGVEMELKTGMVRNTTTGVYSKGKSVAKTETDAAGFYAFENLSAGIEYFVVASSGSSYMAVRALTGNTNVAPGLAAQNYPTLPSEGTYALPTWDYMTRTSGNDEVTIANTAGTISGVLQNFGLVYSDGSISGSVNNMSGSNGNIDVRISSDVFKGFEEDATNTAGRFGLSGVLEGSYTAVIEDAGFASPKVDSATGMPDDDAADWDQNGDATIDPGEGTAPTSISGDTRGRQDHASLGTLHVYSSTMGADDNMTGVSAMGVTAPGDTAVLLGTAATGITQTSGEDSTAVSGPSGTVVYRGGTVSVTPTLMDPGTATARRARASVTVNGPTTACPGGVCTLLANATGGDNAGTARENTIRVMVTAHNGYNDHMYYFTVSRAAPADNVLEASEITGGGSGGTDAATGTGTLTDPFTTTTASATATSVVLTIGLAELGTGDDAYCAQSVSVKVYNGDDVEASADTEQDACSAGEDNAAGEGEQYSFSVGTLYQLTVMSEDDVPATYYISVTAGT